MTDSSQLFSGKITIFGVGLLGGSFALALRKCGAPVTITGCGRSEERLRRACEHGIIDAFTTDAAAACKEADLILLATPVETFRNSVADIRQHLKPGVIITDVGSVKGLLVSRLDALMPGHARFVGAHPIAGGEASGFEAARADLFEGERCIITPTPKTDPNALRTVTTIWESLGMQVEQMSPERHDAVFAQASHFPHLVAYALVNAVAEHGGDALSYAGSGFRDTTRIAQSSPELWSGILMANRDEVLAAGAEFRKKFEQIMNALAAEDLDSLRSALARAQTARASVQNRRTMGE